MATESRVYLGSKQLLMVALHVMCLTLVDMPPNIDEEDLRKVSQCDTFGSG